MAKHRAFAGFGTFAVAAALLGLLVVTVWGVYRFWTSFGPIDIPTGSYVAIGLGAVFMVIVGCGLMALMFYSNRHGYDEPPRREDDEQG